MLQIKVSPPSLHNLAQSLRYMNKPVMAKLADEAGDELAALWSPPMPKPGQIYAFQYSDHEATNQILPLLVVDVDNTHVYYTFPDSDFHQYQNEFRRVYPMIKSVWNKDVNRVLVGCVELDNLNAK